MEPIMSGSLNRLSLSSLTPRSLPFASPSPRHTSILTIRQSSTTTNSITLPYQQHYYHHCLSSQDHIHHISRRRRSMVVERRGVEESVVLCSNLDVGMLYHAAISFCWSTSGGNHVPFFGSVVAAPTDCGPGWWRINIISCKMQERAYLAILPSG